MPISGLSAPKAARPMVTARRAQAICSGTSSMTWHRLVWGMAVRWGSWGSTFSAKAGAFPDAPPPPGPPDLELAQVPDVALGGARRARRIAEAGHHCLRADDPGVGLGVTLAAGGDHDEQGRPRQPLGVVLGGLGHGVGLLQHLE